MTPTPEEVDAHLSNAKFQRWDIVDALVKGEQRRAVFLGYTFPNDSDPNGEDGENPWGDVILVTGNPAPPFADDTAIQKWREETKGTVPMGRLSDFVSNFTLVHRFPFPPK